MFAADRAILLLFAAFLAISDRLLDVKLFALAGPPFNPPLRPNAAAAAFMSSSGESSLLLSLVAISTIDLAFLFTSVGNFRLFAI